MKYIIWILILSFLLSGCYSSKSFIISKAQSEKQYDEITYKSKNKTVQIDLLTRERFVGKSVIVTEVSTKWFDMETGTVQSVSTFGIKEVTIEKRNAGKGAAQGFLIGTILSILIGIAAGSDCSDPNLDGGDFCLGKKDLVGLGVVFVGFPFSIIGAIGGAATKTTDSYLFSDSIKNELNRGVDEN